MNTPEIIQPNGNPLAPSGREIDCFIASLDGDFALKVPNDQEDRYEDLARIATGELVPDRFCYFDNDTSMKNFAEDAMAGVPMMQSHNTYWDVGIGYTFLSEHLKSKKEVNIGFFILRDMGLNGQYSYDNTNSYVLALEKKAIREVSMGISGGRDICSICGGNIRSYRECPHFPGREYEIGAKKTKKLCTYTIYDARLDEVSLVANGAVPGSMILKAQEMIYNKEISIDDVAKALSKRYPKIDIPQTIFHNSVYSFSKWGGASPEEPNSEEKASMSQPQDLQPTIAGLQASHPTLNIPNDPVEALNYLATSYAAAKSNAEQYQTQVTASQQTITTLQQEKAALELTAKDGETYREEWYNRAKAAHIARFGGELADVYVSLFDNKNTPASEIRKYAETWEGELDPNQQQGGQANAGQQPTGQARTQDPNPNQHQQGGNGTRILLPKAQRTRV